MRTTLAIALALIASPALAQSQSNSPSAPRTPLAHDRGYDKPDPRTDAINAPIRPRVAAANNAVAAASANQIATNAKDEAQYAADMAAYRTELAAHDATLAADAAFAARQERAYADAMTAWRIQVNDCRRGVRAACEAPTPRPADYW